MWSPHPAPRAKRGAEGGSATAVPTDIPEGDIPLSTRYAGAFATAAYPAPLSPLPARRAGRKVRSASLSSPIAARGSIPEVIVVSEDYSEEVSSHLPGPPFLWFPAMQCVLAFPADRFAFFLPIEGQYPFAQQAEGFNLPVRKMRGHRDTPSVAVSDVFPELPRPEFLAVSFQVAVDHFCELTLYVPPAFLV